MSAVQGLLVLGLLSMMMGKSFATYETTTELRTTTLSSPVLRPSQKLRTTTLSPPVLRPSQSSFVGCPPDVQDAEAYKIEHPICSRLSARHRHRRPLESNETLEQSWCWSVRSRGSPSAYNVTLSWDTDISRAASALFAVLLRHVMGFQRVNLAHKSTHEASDELVISLAKIVEAREQDYYHYAPHLGYVGESNVPYRQRLHAWLTPAARSRSACRSTNWTFYSNLTALSYCGFIDDLSDSYLRNVSMDAMEVRGVGDDSKPTMQTVLKRAKAAGIPARAIFVNRTDFEHELRTSKYSFLFLDFDIWHGEPSVSVVEPPACLRQNPYRNIYYSDCQLELDYAIGKLVIDRRIRQYESDLFELAKYFKPTPESLRAILGQEANGVNLEEAACEWTENSKSYFSEMFSEKFSENLENMQNRKITYVAIYVCYTDGASYDKIIASVAHQLFAKTRLFNIVIPRYFVNCSDPEHMARRLDELMQGPRGARVLGVVSLSVAGAAAAARAAAAHRVPLLLTAPAPGARAASTWLASGRLRHVALALHYLVSETGCTRVAVLSQPTTFAQHYLAELQDKAKFFLRNFEIPLNLTEQLAKVVLQDLQATKTRVVLVNTDSDAAALILGMAIKLDMRYTDGFIWVLREPLTGPMYSTTHFTFMLSNKVENKADDALAYALETLETGFGTILEQDPSMLNDLHSDQVIRALDDALKERTLYGHGQQVNYKERAFEDVDVYVDKWGGELNAPQRVATLRVNATSGAVRDSDGWRRPPALNLQFCVTHGSDLNSSDDGLRSDANSAKQRTRNITPTNTSYIVRQWTQSITKVETSKSDLSESDILKFFKFN
ncbi:hypothetical protein PYW07_012360 [Mythimna separata]|uniref:Receptor ligand binding region domain-containing protein n=1 Tax=Mythimna separata TaxID=271217 RepID=A0AAD7YN91_MYTSE|nr:hypothetical protein PYW07_012360 [Mythimna separata]